MVLFPFRVTYHSDYDKSKQMKPKPLLTSMLNLDSPSCSTVTLREENIHATFTQSANNSTNQSIFSHSRSSIGSDEIRDPLAEFSKKSGISINNLKQLTGTQKDNNIKPPKSMPVLTSLLNDEPSPSCSSSVSRNVNFNDSTEPIQEIIHNSFTDGIKSEDIPEECMIIEPEAPIVKNEEQPGEEDLPVYLKWETKDEMGI